MHKIRENNSAGNFQSNQSPSDILQFCDLVTELTAVLKTNSQQQAELIAALREDISQLAKSINDLTQHHQIGVDNRNSDKKRKRNHNLRLEDTITVMLDCIKLHSFAHLIDGYKGTYIFPRTNMNSKFSTVVMDALQLISNIQKMVEEQNFIFVSTSNHRNVGTYCSHVS